MNLFKYLLFICIFSLAKSLTAQTMGDKNLRIVYHYSYKNYKNQVEPRKDLMYLDIADTTSYFYSRYWQRTREIEDSLNKRGNFDLQLRDKITAPYKDRQQYRIFKGIPSQNTLSYIYESSDFIKYQEKIANSSWEIKDRDTLIAGYPCQMATTTLRGTTWIVWFTTDIPISDGPWKLCGLPGLILKANDTNNYFDFECAGIQYIEKQTFSLSKYKGTTCTPEEFFKWEKEKRVNPFGDWGEDIPEKLKEFDIRNNPEKLANLIYIETY